MHVAATAAGERHGASAASSELRHAGGGPRGAAAGGAAAAAALVVGLGAVGPASAIGGAEFELPFNQPEVTRESSDRAVALAARLRDAGAKMYGAFWCSHCFEQEQAFGKQAMAAFPYVECFPDGWKRGVEVAPACAAVPVQAFPTWVVGSQVVEGELDFDTLTALLDAQASGSAAVAAPTAEVAAAQ
ncbi:MAG: hypothetical protein J3K34DRAFT_474223 [Monoraphidium minutum]|nr:MAG: hypothetical protein J3K34DRAFT_474223 [Monoraphidium minutum]